MLDFLKMIWRTFVILKDLVFGVIALAILLVAILAFTPGAEIPVPEKTALVLNLDGFLVDQRSPTDPLALVGSADGLISETLLRDVITAIDRAAKDKRVAALTLELDEFYGGGPGTLETVADALRRFKKTGKPIYAYGRYYTEPQFYLASLADEVWLHPFGGVVLRGYGQYNLYLKDALDQLKVSMHIFKAGKYKAFVEPYSRDSMSEEARVSIQSLYNDLWNNYVQDVDAARKNRGFRLTPMIANAATGIPAMKGDLANYALANKAVDKLGTYSTFIKRMESVVGEGEDLDGLPSYNQIDLDAYLAATADQEKQVGDAVGVIYVTGEIVDGEAPPGMAGGDTIARMIRESMDDDDIKALVVRIDSPGGSATAAETIREQLLEAKAKGLPVIASMGSVAASGGYWIASAADEIWAEPSTITGSIGVFGILPTFERTLDAVGVRSDGIGTTPLSDIGDLSRPLSPAARDIVQSTVEHTYRRFLGIVSSSRKITTEAADAAGQGRPWSGKTALSLKLVDRLGGVDKATAAAAKLAKLKNFRLAHIDPTEPWATMLIRKLTGAAMAGARTATPSAFGTAEQLRASAARLAMARVTGLGSVQAVCLECMPMLPPRRMSVAEGRQTAAVLERLGTAATR